MAREWHTRVPDYRIAQAAALMERGGQLRLQHLPLDEVQIEGGDVYIVLPDAGG